MDTQTQTDTQPKPIDLKKLERQIKAREKRFNAADKAGKRVLIAKDVLADIKAQKLIAKRGSWIDTKEDWYGQLRSDTESTFSRYVEEHEKNIELRDKLAQMPSCTVCALGACFVSAVKRVDKLKLGALVGETDEDGRLYNVLGTAEGGWGAISKYLGKFFTKKQLELIETAFERGGGHTHAGWKAEDFWWQYDNDQDRMVAIMKNIIKNNGTFVP